MDINDVILDNGCLIDWKNGMEEKDGRCLGEWRG